MPKILATFIWPNVPDELRPLLDSIPNCSIADCDYKGYTDTGKCDSHTRGIPLRRPVDGELFSIVVPRSYEEVKLEEKDNA